MVDHGFVGFWPQGRKNLRNSVLGVRVNRQTSVRLPVSLSKEMGHRMTMKFGRNIGSGDLMVHVMS